MLASLRRIFLHPPGGPDPEDGINLRRWFLFYCAWLTAMAAAVWWAQTTAPVSDSPQFKLMLLSLMAFYLSLCCTFCPLPTSWIVMLLASNGLHLIGSPFWRMIVVAAVGALGTGIANLNEYHIFTFILRYGKVARIRQTGLYNVAAKWFAVSPFAVLTLISFIPIPVDFIRWLACTCRYPRDRFFAAYYIGRFFRYALWAATTMWLDFRLWHIILVQVGLVILAAGKIAHGFTRRRPADKGVAGIEHPPGAPIETPLAQRAASK